MFKFVDNRGLASLPTVLALGALILTIGVSLGAMSFSENLVTLKASQAPKALYFAEAGARDALQKLARNKNFVSESGYEVEFFPNGCTNLDGCAIITVEATVDGRSVTSIGKYKSSVRKVRVTVVWDAESMGEVVSQTWQEITN